MNLINIGIAKEVNFSTTSFKTST